MKEGTERIRIGAFYVLLAAFAGLCGLEFGLIKEPTLLHWALLALFGIIGLSGLTIVWQTVRLKESMLSKLFFILAGGSAVGLPVCFPVAMLMDYVAGAMGWGRPFPPDGFAEFYILGAFPILFVIGTVGSVVCVKWAKK